MVPLAIAADLSRKVISLACRQALYGENLFLS
jgi:hypothetical protein